MTVVWIPTGLPGSGKSTWARTLSGEALRFNTDDYRAMMWGDHPWNKQNEYSAQQAAMQGMLAAVKNGRDVVWDNTNLIPAPLKRIKSLLYLHPEVEFKIKSFLDVPVEECIRRDAERDRTVGEAVIQRLLKSHKSASKSGWRLTEEWMNSRFRPVPYVPDVELPQAVLVDIDGTLAMKGDRGPFEFENCHLDTLNESVEFLLWQISNNNGNFESNLKTHIIIMSGRGEEYREQTEAWLDRFVVHWDEFHMRPAGDNRPDYEIKHELFNQHVRNRFNVQVSFDDRDQVVNLWRAMGISCHQVNPGDF